MNEGEFKKQSLTQKEIVEKQCEYSCSLEVPRPKVPRPNENELFIPYNIINEAKKEWDKIEPINANCSEDEKRTIILIEHYKWVLKWFGE